MKHFLLLLLSSAIIFLANAQEEPESDSYTDLGADIVSSYIWRGLAINPTPNIQGWGEFGINGFALGAWASANFNGDFVETDLYIGYSYNNFKVTLTDYKEGWEEYFTLDNDITTHAGELALAYTISEKIPLQILGGVMIYGNDKKIDSLDAAGEPVFSDKNNYSTYFELQYTITHGETDISFTGGMVTHESYFYSADGLAVINLGIKLEKSIKINENYGMPINFSVIANPELESLYAVFGVRF